MSGHEDLVRNLIRSEIDGLGEIEQDSIGNLYLKVGEGHPRVMISAHMDEIGFMVKHIDKKGFIRIELVGGWDPRVFPSQRAILIDKNGEKLEGVVGSKPPHIQSRKEMEKAF
ncbi:M42 family peptidase, partial [Thermococci archaeon]